jgi:hypothetical protein
VWITDTVDPSKLQLGSDGPYFVTSVPRTKPYRHRALWLQPLFTSPYLDLPGSFGTGFTCQGQVLLIVVVVLFAAPRSQVVGMSGVSWLPRVLAFGGSSGGLDDPRPRLRIRTISAENVMIGRDSHAVAVGSFRPPTSWVNWLPKSSSRLGGSISHNKTAHNNGRSCPALRGH